VDPYGGEEWQARALPHNRKHNKQRRKAMIKYIRAIHAESGKGREAMQWAREAAEWINARQPGANVQVFREVFGNAGTIYWVGDGDDVATLERRTTERDADPEWRALLERSAGLFVPGSLRDTLLRAV
jgi:hypothetical protein